MVSLTGKRWQESKTFFRGNAEDCVRHLVQGRSLHSESVLPAPFLFPDMEKACTRIQEAIRSKEVVGIFGDYDCDGITATAQLVRFFRRHGIEPVVRLPHRMHDGYGLKTRIVDELKAKGVTLLITTDTGISSAPEIDYAHNQGMEVIVTDHHHLPTHLPKAFALIHPALSAQYPTPHPSGAGVVYQLIRALEGNFWDDRCVDTALAAIGTVGDLVELRGPNRLLVEKGLECLYELAESPLATLRNQCIQTGKYPTSRDIGFGIAPRINAAGRMEDPMTALRALLDGGEDLLTLQELNQKRQEETRTLTKEATERVQYEEKRMLLSMAHEEYPHGIIGLIAGRLTEQFGKPSCIGAIDGDVCTVSLRSIPEYNIIKGLELCSDLLESFGGHSQAAGCTLRADQFPAMTTRLEEHIRATVDADALRPTLLIDGELQATDFTLAFVKQVRTLEPFGQGNPEPRFLLRGVQPDSVRVVGKDQTHLQATIGQTKSVGFGLGMLKDQFSQPIDIVCRVGIDTWNGKESAQLFIDDVRVSERVYA